MDYPTDLELEDKIIALEKEGYRVIYKKDDEKKQSYMMDTSNKNIFIINTMYDNDRIDLLERTINTYGIDIKK